MQTKSIIAAAAIAVASPVSPVAASEPAQLAGLTSEAFNVLAGIDAIPVPPVEMEDIKGLNFIHNVNVPDGSKADNNSGGWWHPRGNQVQPALAICGALHCTFHINSGGAPTIHPGHHDGGS